MKLSGIKIYKAPGHDALTEKIQREILKNSFVMLTYLQCSPTPTVLSSNLEIDQRYHNFETRKIS